MPKKMSIKKIAKLNPQVDIARLEEGRRLRESLRRSERPAPLPFTRKRAQIVDYDIEGDPRVIHLRRRA